MTPSKRDNVVKVTVDAYRGINIKTLAKGGETSSGNTDSWPSFRKTLCWCLFLNLIPPILLNLPCNIRWGNPSLAAVLGIYIVE